MSEAIPERAGMAGIAGAEDRQEFPQGVFTTHLSRANLHTGIIAFQIIHNNNKRKEILHCWKFKTLRKMAPSFTICVEKTRDVTNFASLKELG